MLAVNFPPPRGPCLAIRGRAFLWASVPIETEPSKYDSDLVVLLLVALNAIRVYESIILSGIAGTEYGRLPWLALSILGGYTSNAASEGCHSIAQLIMSDLHFHG